MGVYYLWSVYCQTQSPPPPPQCDLYAGDILFSSMTVKLAISSFAVILENNSVLKVLFELVLEKYPRISRKYNEY